jgi:hypothetical protein
VNYKGDLPTFLILRNGTQWPLHNADKSDYRPDDPVFYIGALLPKGIAKNDKFKGEYGFVRTT